MTRMHLFRHMYAYATVVLACSSPLTQASSFNWDSSTHQVVQADFNHDGYADLLFQAITAEQKHYLIPGDGVNPQRFDFTQRIELPQKIGKSPWDLRHFKLLALQRGQQGAALLAIAQNGSSALLFQRITNTRDLTKPTQTYDPKQNKWLREIESPDYYSGDFNGDGKADLLQLDNRHGKHQIILAEKNQRFETARKLTRTVQWGLKNNERLIIRDFNKDGQDDVFALSKDGKQPHVLLYSDGKGGFDKDDGKIIPVKQAHLTWADHVSGIFPVTRSADQQSLLFRVYNEAERTAQNKACLGWFFDTEMMVAKEYCPQLKTTNIPGGDQANGVSVNSCSEEMFSGGAAATFQACPGSLVPITPTTAPRFSFGVATRGVPFTVSLASTGDETALTYQLSAQDTKGNILYLGAVASPLAQSPAKPTASISTTINAEGVFKLMYRSCNYNGCSGFGPSTTISVTQPVVTHTVSASAMTGGSISPDSAQVIHAQTTSFKVSTAVGFAVASVNGCEGNLSGSTYTTGPVTDDCEVKAEFNRLSYTVNSATDGGGTISPTPSIQVFHGDIKTFIVTPATGMEVLDINGCNGKRNGHSYTTGPITSACDVKATFKTKTFTVTATAAANGTIDPPKKTIEYGKTTTFTVTPNTGYSATATGCDGKLVGTVYTTGVITADCEVKAEFNRQPYTVNSATDGGGTISPTPSIQVFHGDIKTFIVTPATGMEVLDINGCNGKRNGHSYTTGPITSACDVKATFKTKTFTVTATAAANGTIDPPKRTIEYGKTTTFTVTPNTGYSATATGCDGKLVGTVYTTGVITADCEVKAEFNRQPYTVNSATDGGGTISPTPSIQVFHGDIKTFIVTPATGMEVLDINGCNGKRNGYSYTTGPITSACDVKATFKTKTFTVTATAAANGTIDPPKRTIEYGKTTTFTVTPNTGYSATATGCDGKLVGTVYTTGPITSACIVNATFTVQASAQTIYLHTDVLGSVILETDASGNVKKRTEYKPFGESKDN